MRRLLHDRAPSHWGHLTVEVSLENSSYKVSVGITETDLVFGLVEACFVRRATRMRQRGVVNFSSKPPGDHSALELALRRHWEPSVPSIFRYQKREAAEAAGWHRGENKKGRSQHNEHDYKKFFRRKMQTYK